MTRLAAVLGVGASTPLGFDARQTALFVRASKVVPRRTALLDRTDVEPGTVRALRLGDDVFAADRMIAFAADAATEALLDAGVPDDAPLAVLLALPEATRAFGEEQAKKLHPETFLELLAARMGRPLDRARSEAVRVGHAGFAVLLERALPLMTQGPVLVGGADSYFDARTLSSLVDAKRLLCGSIHNGFLPSEGAAFVVLGAAPQGRPALGHLVGVASGLCERGTLEDPRVAELTTELVRKVGETVGVKPLPWVLPDVSGERHRVKEWSFACIRNGALVDLDVTREERLYEETGELGAATGAVYAVQVIQGFRTGFAPADRALVVLASDGDERGAFALEASS